MKYKNITNFFGIPLIDENKLRCSKAVRLLYNTIFCGQYPINYLASDIYSGIL